VRILITGTRGFAGSHVARALAKAGHHVIAAQRSGREPEGTELARIDLAESFALDAGLDAVVHAAATSPQPGVDDAAIVRDNVVGTRNLVEAARRSGVRNFVFLSSLSLYGEITAAEVDEDTPRLNPDVYGATKQLGESLAASLAERASVLALRLPGVVGQGAGRNWLSGLLARLRGPGPVSIFNPDAPFNNAVHVDDLAALLERLLVCREPGFEPLTLGARDALPVREVALRLASAVGYTGEIAVRPAPRPAFTISSRRAIERYGYAPMTMAALLERYAADEQGAERT
jgi:nucleoside-diphosphate-sugar epimerase